MPNREKLPANTRSPLNLVIGGFFSVTLLVFFFALQARQGPLLEIRSIFLLVSLVPVALGFVAGGFGRIEIPAVIKCSPPDELVDKLTNDLKKEPGAQTPSGPQPLVTSRTTAPDVFTDWRADRMKEYVRTQGYMLAHVYRPSNEPGQRFEVFVFLARHRKGTSGPPQREKFSEIDKAEFFFGASWGNKVFEVPKTEGAIGVRTHAWGTFLASCRITFTDAREPITLFRYVDFFMAPEPKAG